MPNKKKKVTEKEFPRIMMIDWRLCSEWLCVAKDVTEEELTQHYKEMVSGPIATPEQIADRMYGGFHCPEDENRIHIYHDSGAYTYSGTNTGLHPDDRKAVWTTLLGAEGNFDQPFHEGNIFTKDVIPLDERGK
jgi:hypothetical protein